MKPTGCPVASKAAIPASPLVAIPIPASLGRPICPSCCSTASAVRGALVMRTIVRPSPSPLQQPLGRAGIKVHAVVNHAPDIAQDQPVSLRQRVENAHSSPASISACSIGATSSGIVELPERERRGFDIDHRDRHAGDEEAKLLEPLERLELADRRRDVTLQRFGPIRINADVQPHRRHWPVQRALRQMRDQPLGEIERLAQRVRDHARPANAPGRFLGLKRAHFVARRRMRRRRDERVAIVLHARDQGFDEARRGQQRVALEIDDEVGVVERGQALRRIARCRCGIPARS